MRGADVQTRLAALDGLGLADLRKAWWQRHGSAPPNVGAALLHLALAYAVQKKALGGLSAASQAAITQCGRSSQRRSASASARRAQPVRPGMRLIRQWRGTTHIVMVDTDGSILWNGDRWKSLSTVARQITGTNWSGPRFFGLAAEQQAGRKAGPSKGTVPDREPGREPDREPDRETGAGRVTVPGNELAPQEPTAVIPTADGLAA